MKYSHFQRLLTGCIGLLIASASLAMPPAPAGPYQSIEDDFIRAESARKPVDAKAKAQPTIVQQASSNDAHDWNWSAPSVRRNDPAIKTPQDGYPPVRQGSGYQYHPNGAPR